MRGLFINNKKAKDSIYESGYMAYQCLLLSKQYELDYIEVDATERTIATGYDFYFFNYHPMTMQWLDTRKLKKDLGFTVTIILEVAPGDPFVLCPSNHFNSYCVLDPTIKEVNNKVYAFPRPLERLDFELPLVENTIPVIGSFGFATRGKGFQHVVDAVNKEFDKAIIRINIPYGDFVPNSKEYASYLAKLCKETAKEGIEVRVTHDFMSKEELIKWCAANTLNCFLYDRNIPGLSATTDQAIVTGRPLSVSNNDTFRHITAYLPAYPEFGLKDSIQKSGPFVKKMQTDWSQEKFVEKFEKLLADNAALIKGKTVPTNLNYDLPISKNSIIEVLGKRFKKYRRKIKKINFNTLFNNDSKRSKKII